MAPASFSAAGHILTDRQLTDGCQVIVVSGYGDADRQAEDAANDLVLLRGIWSSRLGAGRLRAGGFGAGSLGVTAPRDLM